MLKDQKPPAPGNYPPGDGRLASTLKLARSQGPPPVVNGRSIHSASLNSSAAYLPYSGGLSRPKQASAGDVYERAQRIRIRPAVGLLPATKRPDPGLIDPSIASKPGLNTDAKVPGTLPAAEDAVGDEIPTFAMGQAQWRDAILFVEQHAALGKTHGAVKLQMDPAYVAALQTQHSLDADLFTFKTNRLLNNPAQSELLPRLRFYHKLMDFHLRHLDSDQKDLSATPTQQDTPTGAQPTLADSQDTSPQAVDPALKTEPTDSLAVPQGPDQATPKPVASPPQIAPDVMPAPTDDLLAKTALKPRLPVFLTKFPMMDKRPLDLYDLFRFVIRKGGFLEVINRKLWAQVGRELGYKGKITSSLSSSLKMSYAKILYPLELSLGDKVWDFIEEQPRQRPQPVLPKPEIKAFVADQKVSDTPTEEAAKQPKIGTADAVKFGVETQSAFPATAFTAPAPQTGTPTPTSAPEPPKTDPSPSQNGPETELLSAPSEVNEAGKRPSSVLETPLPPATFAEPANHQATIQNSHSKRRKLNTSAPLVVGSSHEFRRSVRLKSAKGLLLNDPHLMDLKTPLVISVANPTALPLPETQAEGQKGKAEVLITPIGAPAQVNNYLKWLACFSSVLQDSSRLECTSKLATTYSLRQYLERDTRLQEFLLSRYADVFSVPAGQGSVGTDAVVVSPETFEDVYWQFLWDRNPEYLKIENCPKISSAAVGFGPSSVGAGFVRFKSMLHSSLGSEISGDSPDEFAKGDRASLVNHPTFVLNVLAWSLHPFNLQNLSHLPNSISGAYSASDVDNRDMTEVLLNIGMTFSTENWKCEDHFTQLASCHVLGKPKRWFFIAEADFDKFEALVLRLTAEKNAALAVPHLNGDISNWALDELMKVVDTDDETINTQYECISNILENIINPFPEIRAQNENDLFQKLIDLKKKRFLRNQEILVTPEILRSNGIRFTTTLQHPGEVIFKYPRTYSFAVSLGFNICQDVNFASKLWLDYGADAETWMKDQGLLPNMLFFKLLINFAQLHENSGESEIYFGSDIYQKVMTLYSEMCEQELDLRQQIRSLVKIKEVMMEERNMCESEFVADDDFLNAFPSRIVIQLVKLGLSFIMAPRTFQQYLSQPDTKLLGDLTFADIVKDKNYLFEFDLFYSDEKLRSYQRSLGGYSVDYEAWHNKYRETIRNEEDLSLKTYKTLLVEGQKICLALSEVNETFTKFCFGEAGATGIHQNSEIIAFKELVADLRQFVDETSEIIDQCQAILSLKHQQRIRGGSDDSDELSDSLHVIVYLTNKIPLLNLHTHEFEQIFEFKNEIQNFDRACRALMEQKTATLTELNDMISLGTSFGVKIPSLTFLMRLRDRLKWMKTYDVIVSGGDPFSGKKEIYSLPDIKKFYQMGLDCLASDDMEKLKYIQRYITKGDAYDAAVKAYLEQNLWLNMVDLKQLDAAIVDMEEKSKLKGEERLFVELGTYQKLVDLRDQEKYIVFLQNFSQKKHKLHDVKQTLVELAERPFKYLDVLVKEEVAKSEAWVDSTKKILEKIKILQKPRQPPASLKHVCDSEFTKRAQVVREFCLKSFADNTVDKYEHSLLFLFAFDLQDELDDQSPIHYCMCREIEEGTMIECDRCHEWYHVTCVEAVSTIGGDDDNYTCPACLSLEKPDLHTADRFTYRALREVLEAGRNLTVTPAAEVSLIQKISDIVDAAIAWVSSPEVEAKIKAKDPLFVMFMYRKFFGAPVLVESVVDDLAAALKALDLTLAFERKEKDIEAPAPAETEKPIGGMVEAPKEAYVEAEAGKLATVQTPNGVVASNQAVAKSSDGLDVNGTSEPRGEILPSPRHMPASQEAGPEKQLHDTVSVSTPISALTGLQEPSESEPEQRQNIPVSDSTIMAERPTAISMIQNSVGESLLQSSATTPNNDSADSVSGTGNGIKQPDSQLDSNNGIVQEVEAKDKKVTDDKNVTPEQPAPSQIHPTVLPTGAAKKHSPTPETATPAPAQPLHSESPEVTPTASTNQELESASGEVLNSDLTERNVPAAPSEEANHVDGENHTISLPSAAAPAPTQAMPDLPRGSEQKESIPTSSNDVQKQASPIVSNDPAKQAPSGPTETPKQASPFEVNEAADRPQSRPITSDPSTSTQVTDPAEFADLSLFDANDFRDSVSSHQTGAILESIAEPGAGPGATLASSQNFETPLTDRINRAQLSELMALAGTPQAGPEPGIDQTNAAIDQALWEMDNLEEQ